jgi:hypothetical protein|tara:strand:+ start:25 stop:327 length:303 start_codon:yes stop_codon:yes gene_type:complete
MVKKLALVLVLLMFSSPVYANKSDGSLYKAHLFHHKTHFCINIFFDIENNMKQYADWSVILQRQNKDGLANIVKQRTKGIMNDYATTLAKITTAYRNICR